MKELLEKLSNAPGISGHEKLVRDLIIEEVKPYVDNIEIDNMGNLIATKFGNSDYIPDKIMLAAHMDEIGLIVRHIDDKGFIFFNTIGGWFDQTLLNQRMILHTKEKKYYGIVGSKPPHIMKREEYEKVIKIEDMFLDIGANSKSEVIKMGVEIGNQIVPDAKFFTLNESKVSGKALDNRAGCTMLIEILKNLESNANIYAVFTVQEEVGLKGARTAAFKINPDFAFATDVTISGDHPGVTSKDTTTTLGKGVAVTISDASGRGIIVPEIILEKIKKVSEEYDIKIQYEATNGGTTDGTSIHLTREGIPTGVISLPVRYIHTPWSVLDLSDLKSGILLMRKILESW